ncbi:MAG TPA: hypothetical protein VES20_15625 [Bryobacteraceae bacterium]|nr:hypothetical protein [Bryobacteraceae bacterium]
MKSLFRCAVGVALLVNCAPAQRDFLTADEVDQVRLAQEPNDRLALYLKFATERLSLIEQAVGEPKPGRSRLIHDLLEDYTKIIEAVDTVSDDALKRKADLTLGIKAVAEQNPKLLERLEKVRDSEPKDIARYQFALDQAIEATRDSAELAAEDLQKRTDGIQVRAKKDLEEREATMRPEEVQAKRAEEKKEAEGKKKAPTLRRKGEVVKER